MSQSENCRDAFEKLMQRCGSCMHSAADVAFLWRLPKVELHAHLNGSISLPLLRHLQTVATSGSEDIASFLSDEALDTIRDPKARMEWCFKAFDAVYKTMNNLAFTRIAVQDVLFHYAAEHTVWLELRTSLREGLLRHPSRRGDGVDEPVSQEDYLRAVHDAADDLLSGSFVYDWRSGDRITIDEDCEAYNTESVQRWFSDADEIYRGTAFLPKKVAESIARTGTFDRLSPRSVLTNLVLPHLRTNMKVALSISVSRSLSLAAAIGTLRVAGAVCGPFSGSRVPLTSVDFSGNCYRQRFHDFVDVLQEMRTLGLKVTLHAGEKLDDDELADMIQFVPERWGHLVYCGNDARQLVVQQGRPIELCPTSNLLTAAHESIDSHHMSHHLDVAEYLKVAGEFHQCVSQSTALLSGAPISFNSDDRGVMSTSMTEEWYLVAQHELIRCRSSDEQCLLLWFLSRRALADAFVKDAASVGELENLFDRVAMSHDGFEVSSAE